MMTIKAIKLTADKASIKVIYEKDGRLFIRTGDDKFKTGVPLQASLRSYMSKWGFRKVTEAPRMADGAEIEENIHRFQISPSDGSVSYHS